jgi:putative SOS response-associated peptidase YedK
MCGRFTVRSRPAEVAQLFGVDPAPFEPWYNIAPSEPIAVVRNASAGRVLVPTIWGLIPSWSKEPKAVPNVRAETVATKPWFRDAFRERRCLIPADGFYEWKLGAAQPGAKRRLRGRRCGAE